MNRIRRYKNGELIESMVDGSPSPARETKPSEWPIWAKALKQLSKPEDKGIGDIVARMIGDEKSEAFKAWHLATFGKPCNCTARQARWNRLYPLP